MAIFYFLVLVSFSAVLAVDQTKQPGAVGPEVVEAVVNLIRESCLFADDKRFLRRLAYVETRDGTAPNTYRLGYDGGIWQVDQDKFLEVQQNAQAMSTQYSIIRNKFGIDWTMVKWSDLRKPLYSGIAAALYTILKGGVGWRIEGQAQFWQNNYHSYGGNNFTNLANILDLGCHGSDQIDLVFVVDSSNSLSLDDFLRAKFFMQDVVKDFKIAPDKTRVAVITYDSHVRTEFYLNSHTTNNGVNNAINNMIFNGGSTKTAEALDQALRNVFTSAHGSRSKAVKVLIVITDGESDDRLNTMHAADRLHDAGIVVFSIGVGTQVNQNELHSIASNPGCTHVFTVSAYEEIKAIKEEVQKSTCIAPLYIEVNKTYSCQIGKCPPLAVLTPTGGVSVESNVTCGHVNVYTAFSNPYPNQAFYEVVKDTSTGKTSIIFRNTSVPQTLYLNLIDALKSTNGSSGCTIYVTPYIGDKTDHSVKCYRDGIQIKCPETDCKEKWNFQNPCTPENIKAGKTKFEYPYDKTKYILCDNRGKEYVVQCPQGESYYQSCQQCVGADTPCVDNKTPLPNGVYDPCSVSNILAMKFFFPYTGDAHHFIHCDVWGKAWLMVCPAGEEWDQQRLTCTVPSAISNPCHNIGPSGPFYFEYPCDPHKYIQCDVWHESFIRTCQSNWVFYPAAGSCVPRTQYNPTTPPPGTPCDASYGSAATVAGVTPIVYSGSTGSSAGYVYCATGTVGCVPFSLPCTTENMQGGKTLFPVFGDKHHYIQCDPVSGYQYLRMCTNGGRDFFDPITQTCTDGPIAVDTSIGR